MKKLLSLIFLGSVTPCLAAPIGAPAGAPILNSAQAQDAAYNVSTGTIRSRLKLPYVPLGCLTVDGSGNVSSQSCFSGGSVGISSLTVNQNGAQVTGPTSAINALSPPFIITSVGIGATAQWTLDPGSATLQGNKVTFAMVGASTASLKTSINSVGISTGSLQTQVTAGGTTYINVDPGSIQSGALNISSGTVGTGGFRGLGILDINRPDLSGFSGGSRMYFDPASSGANLKLTANNFTTSVVALTYYNYAGSAAADVYGGLSNAPSFGVHVSSGVCSGALCTPVSRIVADQNKLILNNPSGTEIFNVNTSSVSAIGATGLGVTYGAIVGSMTVSNLTSGQCVQAGTGGLLTVSGSACGSGSGGGGYAVESATVTFNLAKGTIVSTVTATAFNATTSSVTVTGSGGFAVNGPGDMQIAGTIRSSTATVVSSTGSYTAGHCAGWANTTDYTLIDAGVCGSGGGSVPSTAYQVTFTSANGTQFDSGSNLTNNKQTVTFSGVYITAETNVSTKAFTGMLLDYSASTMTLTRLTMLDHATSSGTVPTITVTGGTSPTMDANSTDMLGRFTWGGTATAATIIFSKSWGASPYCVAASTSSGVGTSAWSVASSTFSFTGLTGSTITYHCEGGRGG